MIKLNDYLSISATFFMSRRIPILEMTASRLRGFQIDRLTNNILYTEY